jgi:anti-sigma B factor antagonist
MDQLGSPVSLALAVMETSGGSLMILQLILPPLEEDSPRDVIVAHFTGCHVSLDEETLYRIHDELLALAEEPSESDLLLDFGNVEYLTSTALGMLIGLHKKLLATGRHLTVGNLCPQIHEVFTVTKLDRLLDLRVAWQEVEPAAQAGHDMLTPLAVRSPRRRQDRWIETPGKGV